MSVVIEVTIVGAPELLDQLAAAPELLNIENQAAMQASLAIAEGEIKALTPRKTGRLFSAWQPRMTNLDGRLVGILGDDVDYAPAVEFGARPHDIVAHGNALMIPIAKGGGFGGGKLSGGARAGQQVAFFKKVHHPGSRGAHMAKDGLEIAKPDILAQFRAAINRVLATVKGA